MRYQYIKRKSGSYDPFLKWAKPYNGKLEFLSILGAVSLVAIITLWVLILMTN